MDTNTAMPAAKIRVVVQLCRGRAHLLAMTQPHTAGIKPKVSNNIANAINDRIIIDDDLASSVNLSGKILDFNIDITASKIKIMPMAVGNNPGPGDRNEPMGKLMQ